MRVIVNNTGDVIKVSTAATSSPGPAGPQGNGIESITLVGTVGLVNTYQILFTDGTTFNYDVTDGQDGVSSGGSNITTSNLDRFNTKLAISPETTTIAFVGDSTSDFAGGGAAGIPGFFEKHVVEGGLLEGFDIDNNLLDFGENGQTIVNFNNNSIPATGIDSVIAASPDLVIFSYGINDVRVGGFSKENLKSEIIISIEAIQLGSPNTDILLRMPNSFLSVSPNNWIFQYTYGSVADAAQAYSDILYEAYKELENSFNNTDFFNTQDLITGRESLPTNFRMEDEIHPKYELIIDNIVETISYKEFKVYSQEQVDFAISSNYETPWVVTSNVFQDERYYTKVGEGSINLQGTTFLDINGFAYELVSKLSRGDVMVDSIGNVLNLIGNFSAGVQTPTVARFLGSDLNLDTAPSFLGNVKFYRNRFDHNQNAERYLTDKVAFPYAHRIQGFNGGNGFLIIGSELADDGFITEKTRYPYSPFLEVQNGDVLVVPGIAPYVLAGANFTTFNNGSQLRIDVGGKDFSAYTGITTGFIFGNHPKETDVPKILTETRDNVSLVTWKSGDEIFNRSISKKQVYNGTGWETITSSL